MLPYSTTILIMMILKWNHIWLIRYVDISITLERTTKNAVPKSKSKWIFCVVIQT